MAYVSKEDKAEIATLVKPILKKYGVKATLAVYNHSTIVLNIKSSSFDFIGNYNKVAPKKMMSHFEFRPAVDYLEVNTTGWFREHFSGKILKFLEEVIDALHGKNYFNHDDIQTDYFHRSHYISVNIGKWDRPYVLTK